jgi:hypothetical protein
MEHLPLAAVVVHTALSKMLKEGCQTAGSAVRIIWGERTTSITTPGKRPGSGQAQASTRQTSAET